MTSLLVNFACIVPLQKHRVHAQLVANCSVMVSGETCVQHACHQASLVHAQVYVRQVLPIATAATSLQQLCPPDVVCQHRAQCRWLACSHAQQTDSIHMQEEALCSTHFLAGSEPLRGVLSARGDSVDELLRYRLGHLCNRRCLLSLVQDS